MVSAELASSEFEHRFARHHSAYATTSSDGSRSMYESRITPPSMRSAWPSSRPSAGVEMLSSSEKSPSASARTIGDGSSIRR